MDIMGILTKALIMQIEIFLKLLILHLAQMGVVLTLDKFPPSIIILLADLSVNS